MTLCVDVVTGTAGNIVVKSSGVPAYVLMPNQLSAEQCTGYLLMDKTDANQWALKFDKEQFLLGFESVFLFFVLGLGIGFVVNIVRKARTP